METITHDKFTTGDLPLFPSRSILPLSAAGVAMPHGMAERQATPTFSPVLLWVGLMPTTTLLMKGTIMSRLSLLLITMLQFLAFWPDSVVDIVATISSFQVLSSLRSFGFSWSIFEYNHGALIVILFFLQWFFLHLIIQTHLHTPKHFHLQVWWLYKDQPIFIDHRRQKFDWRACFAVSSSTPITVEQKMTTSWTAKGNTYYRYSTKVTNKSSKTLKDLKLTISQLYGPLWGLEKSGESYVFPSWLNSLAAGESLEFVYIHTTSPANISVSSYTLS